MGYIPRSITPGIPKMNAEILPPRPKTPTALKIIIVPMSLEEEEKFEPPKDPTEWNYFNMPLPAEIREQLLEFYFYDGTSSNTSLRLI
jgi:hypothetical protein